MSKPRPPQNLVHSLRRALVDERCRLPASLRLFCFVLAQLADWRTGRGIAGQGRLARAMGCDGRSIRRYKTALAAASESPVEVTWRHRVRPDGLNGSDAYVIRLSELGASWVDSGQLDRDTGHGCPPHRTNGPTNISTGVPQGTTPVAEEENEFKGSPSPSDGPLLKESEQGPERALHPNWRYTAQHVKTAKRLGVDVDAALASFLAYWLRRPTERRTAQGWAAGFGAHLNRQAPAAPAPLTPEEQEEAEWQAHLAEIAAQAEAEFRRKDAEGAAAAAPETLEV